MFEGLLISWERHDNNGEHSFERGRQGGKAVAWPGLAEARQGGKAAYHILVVSPSSSPSPCGFHDARASSLRYALASLRPRLSPLLLLLSSVSSALLLRLLIPFPMHFATSYLIHYCSTCGILYLSNRCSLRLEGTDYHHHHHDNS